jgi:hypothetical protein
MTAGIPEAGRAMGKMCHIWSRSGRGCKRLALASRPSETNWGLALQPPGEASVGGSPTCTTVLRIDFVSLEMVR